MAFKLNKDTPITILRILVGILFIFSGITKILNPSEFAWDIDNYRMIPYILVTLMAIILPWLELLCGILLMVGPFKKGASLILLFTSVMFLIAISSALFRGLNINCGCFSVNAESMKISIWKLIENIALFSALLIIVTNLFRIRLIKS
ncbi:DoxX family membrane protein [candidate division KSB1 bacterium]|nr:DoxX family membrane protein [candidate division KSB1 bacterium]